MSYVKAALRRTCVTISFQSFEFQLQLHHLHTHCRPQQDLERIAMYYVSFMIQTDLCDFGLAS